MSSPLEDRPFQRPPWLLLAAVIATALFFLLLIAATRHVQQASQLRLAEQQRELIELENRSLQMELEAEKLLQDAARRLAETSAVAPGRQHPVADVRVLAAADLKTPSAPIGAVWWDATRQQGQLIITGVPADWSGGTVELSSGGTTLTKTVRTPAGDGRWQLTLQEAPPPPPLVVRLLGRPGVNDIVLHER